MTRVLLLCALAAACDAPEVVWEGEHVRVTADPELELCGGSITHMDAFIARLSHEFGRAPPNGKQRIHYTWLREEEFAERSPCPEAVGCASGREIFAREAPLDHELVHSVVSERGETLPFFAEGLATAFQGMGAGTPGNWQTDAWGEPYAASPAVPGDVNANLLIGLPEDLSYAVAGAFTADLVARHGIAAHLRVYSAISRRADRGDIDAAFRANFGVSLDESIRDFTEDPRCAGRPSTLVECSAPELAWDGRRLEEHRSLACDQEDAVGPFAGDSVIVDRTIVIPRRAVHALTVIGDPSSGVALQQCGGCDATAALWAIADAEPATFVLPAGRYVLRLRGPATEVTSVGFRLERVADAP